MQQNFAVSIIGQQHHVKSVGLYPGEDMEIFKFRVVKELVKAVKNRRDCVMSYSGMLKK
ncbi:hypothetical protein L1766_03240 [Thermovorax subterraneus]|nr:hypothetical protein [Thermovorax subterraneus]